MAFNPFGLGFMIPSAEENAQAIVAEEEFRRSERDYQEYLNRVVSEEYIMLVYKGLSPFVPMIKKNIRERL